jgi:hypothetical protein
VDGPIPERPETVAPQYGESRRDGGSPYSSDVTRPIVSASTIKRERLVTPKPPKKKRSMLPFALVAMLVVAAGVGALTIPKLVSGATVLPTATTETRSGATEIAMVATETETTEPEAPPATRTVVIDGPTVTIFNTPAVNLRRGPSAAYSQADTALSGEVLPVLGQDSSQTWYLVALTDNEPLWVSAYFARLEPANARPPIINPRRKLVLTDAVEVHQEANQASESLGTADVSAVAYILREQNGAAVNDETERWMEVVIENGLRGWVLSGDAVMLSTPRPGSSTD